MESEIQELSESERQEISEVFQELSEFFIEFNKESDRGATLLTTTLFDERLLDILKNFFNDTKTSKELLDGFNALL